MKSLLNNAVIFDGGNRYEPAQMRESGWAHNVIGRRIS